MTKERKNTSLLRTADGKGFFLWGIAESETNLFSGKMTDRESNLEEAAVKEVEGRIDFH